MPSTRQRVRLPGRLLATLAALALLSATASTVAAHSANGVRDRAATVMYEGSKRVGSISPGFADPLWLVVDCSGGTGYTGGSVGINARRTWIYVNDMADRHWGTARLLRPGKWVIYFVGKGRSLVGFAKQRTTRRWDVFDHRSRSVGHTLGPDGPQAAAVALTMC